VTILMEQSTGKMWYLGEATKDGGIWVIAPVAVPTTPVWMPLQFLNTSKKALAPPQ